MNIRKTLLAAAVGALPWIIAGPASAAPVIDQPDVANALAAQGAARGLDADHGFVISRQHPGSDGTQVTRAEHTYKGVRIFGSDSVVVSDHGVHSEATIEPVGSAVVRSAPRRPSPPRCARCRRAPPR